MVIIFALIVISDNNWLSAVQYSLSTKTGTLVFAYETKIIVLSNRWESRSHQFKFSITWSDELAPYDNITAVLCLPFANEAEEVNSNANHLFSVELISYLF